MTFHERQFFHAALRVGGAGIVAWVHQSAPGSRLERGLTGGLIALLIAEALDGRRGTTELLRGASWAVRQLT